MKNFGTILNLNSKNYTKLGPYKLDSKAENRKGLF